MHVSLPNTIPKTIPIFDLTESESSYGISSENKNESVKQAITRK
jgi:hypothetical protein